MVINNAVAVFLSGCTEINRRCGSDLVTDIAHRRALHRQFGRKGSP